MALLRTQVETTVTQVLSQDIRDFIWDRQRYEVIKQLGGIEGMTFADAICNIVEWREEIVRKDYAPDYVQSEYTFTALRTTALVERGER